MNPLLYYVVDVDEFKRSYTYASYADIKAGTRVRVPSRSGSRLIMGTVKSRTCAEVGTDYKLIEEILRPLADVSTEDLEAELAHRRDCDVAERVGVSLMQFQELREHFKKEAAA